MPDANEALLQRLWDAYDNTANRRQKSFLWLGTILAIYATLWITRNSTAKLPFLDASVPVIVAFALLPAFLVVFAGQFLFASAHGFRAYMEFIEQFWALHGSALSTRALTITVIHASFKRRDVTELLCPFSIPTRSSREWSATLPNFLRFLAINLTNLISLSLVVTPIAIYVLALVYLYRSPDYWVTFPWPWLPISMYLLALPLLLMAPVYLFLRVRPARRLYRANIG
jgi:hypothetical protein